MSYQGLVPKDDWAQITKSSAFNYRTPLRIELWGYRDCPLPYTGWVLMVGGEGDSCTVHVRIAWWDDEQQAWRTGGRVQDKVRHYFPLVGISQLGRIVGPSARAEGRRIYDVDLIHPGTKSHPSAIRAEAPPLPKSSSDIIP